MQKLRIASLILVHLLIVAHIYIFGDSVIGSLDFQEFFHSFIKHGLINAGTILVFIAFITTLIFGRFFCGWACHFGALQELSWWILKKMKITPKTINSRMVFFLPLFMLVYFYLTPNIISALSDPWSQPKVNLAVPEIWAFLPGFVIGSLTFLVDGVLLVYFLGRKGFCRYLCPWGAFLKLPNAFAMYKVRKTGNCIHCNECTTNCPVGIDVSYEINTYQKVTSTNCTSCLVCTDGCPSNAITYDFMNPLKESNRFQDYFYRVDSFIHEKIKSLFISIRQQDICMIPMVLGFGFAIDGLYGMGHFLSFGIALIGSLFIIQLWTKEVHNYLRVFYTSLILVIFLWHGIIKYSIYQGLAHFESGDIEKSIVHLERVVNIYPQQIGKYHVMLGEMYLTLEDFINARYHAETASKINPDHNSPKQLLELINKQAE